MHSFASAEKFVDVAGTKIRFLDAGSGPPLLLVHGLGQSSTAWRRTLDAFAKHHRVVAPDLPGFGGSDIPDNASLDPAYFAKVLGEFIDALSLKPVDAIGHSAGGLALLLDALDAPQRYRRLVVVDSAGFTPAPDNLLGTAAVSLARLLVSMPRNRAMTRALYATAFYDTRAVDEETVDELVRRRTSPRAIVAARQAFARFFAFCRRLEHFHERLATFDVPVLAIWGGDDRLFRVSDAAVTQRVIRHARIERFDRCGHCPQIERPDRFTDVVLGFLAAK